MKPKIILSETMPLKSLNEIIWVEAQNYAVEINGERFYGFWSKKQVHQAMKKQNEKVYYIEDLQKIMDTAEEVVNKLKEKKV